MNHTKPLMPPVLRTFLLGTMALYAACILVEYVCRHYLNLGQIPYNRQTLAAFDDYADIRMFVHRFTQFHSPSFFSPSLGSPYLYPAPCALLYRVLYAFPHPSKAFLLLIVCIGIALAAWLANALVQRGMTRRGAVLFSASALITSYPLYFEFNRGNIEIFVWGLSALGILAFFRNRPWLAALLIGLAGSCKGYPFLYLGLLFARKQYRQTFFGVAVGVFVNLFSFWAIADNFQIGKRGVTEGLELFRSIYILRHNATGLDHSFFGFFKRFDSHLPSPDVLGHVLMVYLAVAGIGASLIYFFRVRSMPPLNQLLFLAVACLTLPPTSYDYTLLHLYTPWVMVVFLAVSRWRANLPLPKGLWAVLLCFIFLLSPQNEFILHGERLEGQIKCLFLIALAFLALRFPFPDEVTVSP